MPFAPQIRKYILQALDRSILPALQSQAVPQVLAGPPWDFSAVEHWPLRQRYLPPKSIEPMYVAWKKEHLAAGRMPYIGFVYEGVSDDKVGITTRMAKALGSTSGLNGITVLRLPAPAVICFPPGVPRRDGSAPFCEKDHLGFASARIIWMHVSIDELLVHYCESDVDKIYSSHSLQVKDVLLAQLTHAYIDELHHMQKDNNEGMQGLLLVIMKRLQRNLVSHSVPLSNTAWTSRHLTPQGQTQSESEELCLQAIEYIDTQLQGHLSWEIIAEQLGISPFYLNRIFRSTTGMSVMRYVQSMRIESAKLMLAQELECVSDIARLTGFSGVASFSASFKRHVGCTPSEFRRKAVRTNLAKSTFKL